MNDPTIGIMAVAACACIVVCIRSIASATVRHAEVTRNNNSSARDTSDARLARLEVAVESIAVEIERISEGQRFTTRLLNNQAERATPRLERPGKVDTPH